MVQGKIVHATEASNLVDVLERILDKGIVIAGDIRIKLVDIEFLTINIRLLVASVDKAKEMGIDWWEGNPFLSSLANRRAEERSLEEREIAIEALNRRIERLESGIFSGSSTRGKLSEHKAAGSP
ncbi:gas vesicle protein [Candidatus Poribacteria bacterium]|nr:gas vesicle protein [Candidatus Poribacteria bacterium]